MAARLPGRALHVGMALWFLVGMKKTGCVTFSLSRSAGLELSRAAASRGLARLEQAGLVSVTRLPGRNVLVRVLDAPTAEQAGGLRGRIDPITKNPA
jgi:DNA-binding transcriptional ArsR family regulator